MWGDGFRAALVPEQLVTGDRSVQVRRKAKGKGSTPSPLVVALRL
jgi:hypothetical protein